MIRLIVNRLLWAIPVVWGAATLTFIVMHVVPGNPITSILNGQAASPAVVAAIKAQFHLGDPVWKQYLLYLDSLLHGDLGISVSTGQKVSHQIGETVGVTLELAGVAVVFSLVLGIGGGLLASWTRWRIVDRVVSAIQTVAGSTPVFWAGLLLLIAFSFDLRWFPATGTQGFKSVVLPAATLALAPAAIIGQLVRSSMREVLTEPYILNARAKGLSESSVRIHHALRNALISTLSITGVVFGSLITGAVVVEDVFARAGIGQLLIRGISNKDLQTAQGVVILVALTYVVVNLLIDIGYLILDPRLR
jgi:peptide/nickel transport system permease protein